MSNFDFLRPVPIFPGMMGYSPVVLMSYNPAQTHAAATTVAITDADIVIPEGFFMPGTCFQYTIWGNRTGTAGAGTLLIDINGSTAVTKAIPTNTEVDFWYRFLITEYTDFAHQSNLVMCQTSATVLAGYDTNLTTINVSKQTTITPQMTLASASDALIISGVILEYWNVS